MTEVNVSATVGMRETALGVPYHVPDLVNLYSFFNFENYPFFTHITFFKTRSFSL